MLDLYRYLLRPLLFKLAPERAHSFSTQVIGFMPKWLWPTVPAAPVDCLGMHFANPVGLAAGMDKNADFIDGFGRMGFGFIEVGGVTPLPQAGNPGPRLFRYPKNSSLINRLGLNNKGLDYVAAKLEKRQYQGIVGANICKNNHTAIENAPADYQQCYQTLYPLVDYVSANISCPNTDNLHQIQESDHLKRLLSALKNQQAKSQTETQRKVPLLVKLSPDLNLSQIEAMVELLISFEVDGVMASNTTLTRPVGIQTTEKGGLSGAALNALSTQVIKQLHACVQGRLPIIGLGGIMSGSDASEKFQAGASLVQLMTGLVYRGPDLIKECVDAYNAQ